MCNHGVQSQLWRLQQVCGLLSITFKIPVFNWSIFNFILAGITDDNLILMDANSQKSKI